MAKLLASIELQSNQNSSFFDHYLLFFAKVNQLDYNSNQGYQP
jgi:hypothetical protein